MATGAMKRKLDENDEPAAAKPDKEVAEGPSFADLGLDSRLLQAIAQQNFKQPTLVQLKAIPLALEGRDVLAKAKTGSGKTLAFILPVLHQILKRKQTDATASTTALILVPTRELGDQIHKVIETFSAFCAKDVQSVKLTDKLSPAVLRSLLSASPDIVISTPARAWENVNNSSLSLDKLTHLILDEADLVLSYGYEEDLQNVARSMPKGVQTILTSATLSAELDTLKGIFCRNPAILDLEEPEAEGEGVSQFVVKCAEDEKFLLIYVIYKLKLIYGKSIIFVTDIDRCYRLRLYFEQFGIRSVVLNSELPVNCRINVVEEFNRGVYDIIIASDEHEALGNEESKKDNEDESTQKGNNDTTTNGKDDAPPKKKQRPSRKDKEFGVSRGIDFQNVSTVINFDLPTSAKSYTHRIGRTARAGQTGMALSFVIPKANYRKHVPTTVASTENDEKILDKIIKQQAKKNKEVKPYVFDMAQVDAFRYRMNDALRAVTRVAIREARTRELRQELLNSEKLKRHFEENPQEAHHLRHDGELRAVRTQAHLRATHVPDYLLPADGRRGLTSDEVGFVPFRKQGADRKQKRGKGKGKPGGRVFKVGKKKSDPLRSFKARPKSK